MTRLQTRVKFVQPSACANFLKLRHLNSSHNNLAGFNFWTLGSLELETLIMVNASLRETDVQRLAKLMPTSVAELDLSQNPGVISFDFLSVNNFWQLQTLSLLACPNLHLTEELMEILPSLKRLELAQNP